MFGWLMDQGHPEAIFLLSAAFGLATIPTVMIGMAQRYRSWALYRLALSSRVNSGAVPQDKVRPRQGRDHQRRQEDPFPPRCRAGR